MRRQFRTLALLASIGAATAFGAQMAAAHPGSPAEKKEAAGGQQAHKHKHKGERGAHYFNRMAKELGLTEQQKTQAKALKESLRSENKEFFEGMVTEKRKLRSLVHSGTADEAAVRAQAAKVAAAEAELAVKKAQGAKQFLALLTPEQVNKYHALQDKREAKREGKMGGRFGRFCPEDEK